jgi:hypothetical protein
VVPASIVGRGRAVADAVPVAKFVPYAETIDSGANGSTWPAVDKATVKAGAEACTTSVTPTDAGLPPAPAAVVCTVAEYDPAVRFAGFTDTDSAAGAVPDAGERTTQDAPDDAAPKSVPPPAFVIEMF